MDLNKEKTLLAMQHISKSFPGVRALDKVSLQLNRGEVLALVGENGAGKSTLMKILGGAYPADSGEIFIEGQVVTFKTPSESLHSGVSIIYQEFNLIPELSIHENIFLGREKTRFGIIDAKDERQQTRRLLHKLGLDLDAELLCRELTVAQQQSVEIARALSYQSRIIVMDEPSAALTSREVQKLFSLIRELKEQKLGIVYISHRLDEIFEIADKVMILRDGKNAGAGAIAHTSREAIIEMMVGRPLEAEFPEHQPQRGDEKIRVENLHCGPYVDQVSFMARKGEILGFAGLVGAGRTETMRLIFGADQRQSGKIFIDSREVDIRHPIDAIANRICLLTEDRKQQGLILMHSCRENFGLPNLSHFKKGLFIDEQKENLSLGQYIKSLKIKLADAELPVLNLSGGNQQKIVLAKWLESNADIIIFDEPTRGIDVGAKYEIYLLINDLAAKGKSVIIVSSEFEELIGMCDRIIVMHEGRITGEIDDPAQATPKDILKLAMI